MNFSPHSLQSKIKALLDYMHCWLTTDFEKKTHNCERLAPLSQAKIKALVDQYAAQHRKK